VAWGDYDADGDLDLAIGGLTGQSTRIYQNASGSGLSQAVTLDNPGATYDVEWADFDNDGDLDLAMANGTGASYVALNNGAGGFQTVTSTLGVATARVQSIAVADFNKDGFLDVAAGVERFRTDFVFLNQKDGTFGSGTPLGPDAGNDKYSNVGEIVAGDFNGDGAPDIVASYTQSKTVVLYLNDGSGAFGSGSTITETSGTVAGMTSGDFDNDGDLDIYIAAMGDCRAYLNDGSGVFTQGTVFACTNPAGGVSAGDMDGDGDLDVMIASGSGQFSRVYLNNGAAVFSSGGTHLSTGTDNTRAVAWGDYDGDGDLDLAQTMSGENSRLYVNLSRDATLRDLNVTPGNLTTSFLSTTLNYTAEVPSNASSVTVDATTRHVSATVAYASSAGTCTPDDESPASCPISSPGVTVITVTVTPEDFTGPQKVHTIAIVLVEPKDASLNALAIAPGELSPTFVSTTKAYAAEVPEGTPSMAVTATVNSVSATVSYSSTAGACTPGNASPSDCALAASGVTTITVTVTNGSTTEEYVIVVTAVPSDDASLGGLEIDPGTLSPAFVSTTKQYAAEVPNGTTSVAVTATTSDVSATVAYASSEGACNPENAAPSDCAISATDVTTITVIVTAADLTTIEIYTILVTVAAAAPSSDATLGDLTIDPGTLDPAFVSTTTEYEGAVANDVTSTLVTATPNDPAATVTFAPCDAADARGAVPTPSATCPLVVGENVITVTVTAEDDTKQEYLITVVRAAPLTTISLVWPNLGVPEGGMPVALFGTGFSVATGVRVSNTITNTLVPFTITSDGRIDFVMPAGVDGTFADISVETATDSQTVENAFRYMAPKQAEFDGQVGAVITTPNGITITIPPQGVSGMFVVTITPQTPEPGVPGSVLMHVFRLDALLNWEPLASLTNPITIALPVDPAIVPDGETPYLWEWVEATGRPQTADGGRRTAASGRWAYVQGQSYDAATKQVTVALRPMGLYALSTSILSGRSYWFPLVPTVR
jgi:hypothetical protein